MPLLAAVILTGSLSLPFLAMIGEPVLYNARFSSLFIEWPSTFCSQRPPLILSLAGLDSSAPPTPNCAQCHPLLTPLLTGQGSRTHHSEPSTMCPPGAPAHPGCRCRGSCGSEAGAWSGGCQGSAAPAAPLRSPSCCSHCCRST